MLAQIREPQMCYLHALLQAVRSVFCSKGTMEKQCCCAMDGLILDVAYGEIFSLTFQEWNNKLLLKGLWRYYTQACTL